MSTLFEKYGGLTTISALTKLFYQKLLDSPDVAHFFANTNIERLIDHQTQFLSSVLGGPELEKAPDLKAVHSHLTITDADYQAVAEILQETLIESGVEDEDITTILALVTSLKEQIVNA